MLLRWYLTVGWSGLFCNGSVRRCIDGDTASYAPPRRDPQPCNLTYRCHRRVVHWQRFVQSRGRPSPALFGLSHCTIGDTDPGFPQNPESDRARLSPFPLVWKVCALSVQQNKALSCSRRRVTYSKSVSGSTVLIAYSTEACEGCRDVLQATTKMAIVDPIQISSSRRSRSKAAVHMFEPMNLSLIDYPGHVQEGHSGTPHTLVLSMEPIGSEASR